MNLPAISRGLLRFPAKASRFSRRSPAVQPTAIEALEARIAPATLLSPSTVTYHDKSGDDVTVHISKGLFTAANVNNVFTFDTGSVNGVNSADQQLELLNLTKLPGDGGISVWITATPVDGSPGIVNVGFINASNIDLGSVTVGGDLGRIAVGNLDFVRPAINSLTVGSLGAQGIATQAAGGNLNSLFAGKVGAITVNGDIVGATIGIGGGAHGLLGALRVTGSLIGGAAAYSGCVRTQGGINSVEVDGSILGAGGVASGLIGTKGVMGAVTIGGSVTGGSGKFSGTILSSKAMNSVRIAGDLTGGSGDDSGEVGTIANLGAVVVGASVIGGSGGLSGSILATGDILSVAIADGLIGGAGADSGQIGGGRDIETVTIGGAVNAAAGAGVPGTLDSGFKGIQGGVGLASGAILAGGVLNSVTITGNLDGYYLGASLRPAAASIYVNIGGDITAAGGIGSVALSGGVYDGGIVSGESIGTVTIAGALSDFSYIAAHQNLGSLSVNTGGANTDVSAAALTPGAGPGINDSTIFAGGSIGAIRAGAGAYPGDFAIAESTITADANIGAIQAVAAGGATFAILDTQVTALGSLGNVAASSDGGVAICASHFVASGNIGNIAGYGNSSGKSGLSVGILNSTFRAGGGIAGITASSADTVNSGAGAIVSSGFDAGGNIGPITSAGAIAGSVFIAGIDLGTAFSATGAGTFDNASAANFGFGGSTSAIAAHIGNITVTKGATAAGTSVGASAIIAGSTFLAGVHGAGTDGKFGTKDDVVPTGSSIGAIFAPGGLNTVFVESGNIGATTSGAIIDTTYLSTDTAVTSAGIGAVTVTATAEGAGAGALIAGPPQSSTNAGEGIFDAMFISNAGIGNIIVTLDGARQSGENAGIAETTFQAGHALGAIKVTNNASGTAGANYGIIDSTFNGGLDAYGGVSDITVSLTDSGSGADSAAIINTRIDASFCPCMSANMGSISASNAGSAATAAGIVNSVFRVHGNIGNISSTMSAGSPTAAAIEGSTFSAFGSIGAINVYGAVLADGYSPSRFLAGYDIGPDMTFGNEDLTAKSLALQAGQSIGNVGISGYFKGSDIIASVNPGAGYVFGDSTYPIQGSGTPAQNDSNVGSGGSVGYVSIGYNVTLGTSPFVRAHPTSHAIEASAFPASINGNDALVPMVSAFGFASGIPVVLYVDGGSGDILITSTLSIP